MTDGFAAAAHRDPIAGSISSLGAPFVPAQSRWAVKLYFHREDVVLASAAPSRACLVVPSIILRGVGQSPAMLKRAHTDIRKHDQRFRSSHKLTTLNLR